jgi:large repetitive protein
MAFDQLVTPKVLKVLFRTFFAPVTRASGAFLIAILTVSNAPVFSQTCDCPPVISCGPCTGGLTQLTLRYNGLLGLSSTVIVSDGGGIVFNGTVADGGNFSFSGSQLNQPFVGGEISITVGVLPNTTITTSCGSVPDLNSTSGSFTIVGRQSTLGKELCCEEEQMETDKPQISGCPANINLTLQASECSKIVSWTEPTATDACGAPVMTRTHQPGAAFPPGTTRVEYTFTDKYANTSTCFFDVIISDTSNPVLSACPQDITVTLAATECSKTVTWNAPTASDNCLVSLIGSHASGSAFSSGTTTVTYTATDIGGNKSTCSFKVIVKDITSPVFQNCNPLKVFEVTANNTCEAVATWSEPQVTDNCPITITSTYASGSVFPLGKTRVTYTATDAAGNKGTCLLDVHVKDKSNPVLTACPANIVVPNGSCGVATTWVPPQASDNCSVTLSSNYQSGHIFPPGITTVTYTGTDGSGNTATCSFTVTVNDNVKPVINACPAGDILASATSSCGATVSWDPPTFSDNCGTGSFTSTHTPGQVFPVGTTTVTYTATDVIGNSTLCTFRVIVTDNAAPVLTGCPSANVLVYLGPSSCQATATWNAPTVSDHCPGVTLTSNYKPGDAFQVGTTAVVYTAKDPAGNTSTCSFNVVVKDRIAPVVVSSPPAILALAAGPDCETPVIWDAPAFQDNCAIESVMSTRNPGDVFQPGSEEVVYTAKDRYGNSTIFKFTITVEDKTGPVFASCLDDVVVIADASCSASVSWSIPDVTDNCELASVTSSHVPGQVFSIGSTEVTYTARDARGNISVCKFNVVVQNKDAPLLSGCVDDIIARAGQSGEVAVSWEPPTASVTCGEVFLTASHSPGDVFPLGSTTVEYVATDVAGNSAACTFNVIVSYDEVEFDAIKVLTPNGDGINDEWILKNIEKFSGNKVTVVDRWGSVVFSASGYNNESVIWKGVNTNGAILPTGTYFYTIAVHIGQQVVEKKGFIELIQ